MSYLLSFDFETCHDRNIAKFWRFLAFCTLTIENKLKLAS